MKTLLFSLLLLGVLLNGKSDSPSSKPLDSSQLIVVKTADFNTVQGQLSYYERNAVTGRWVKKLPTFAITVGRKGLAWGAGLHEITNTLGSRKREGDGKSPAGIFPIGTAFGSRPATEVRPLHIPYILADSTTFCVDDPASAHYNQIVNTDTLRVTWNSAERMLISAYQYGLVVEYNYPNAKANDGSCIFIHLWQGRQIGTSGCTAMNEANLLKLLRLLDTSKRPLLVQMPEREYARWRSTYRLP